MNKTLLKEIISHVLANFVVIPSDFIDPKLTGSLLDRAYILPEKFCFEADDITYENEVWGCQLSALQNEVKVLATKVIAPCETEFVMVVQSKDAPVYGLNLCYNAEAGAEVNDFTLAVSLDGKDWMECATFLQATFLAAMEQVKDLGSMWQKCSEYKSLYDSLISFVKYHDSQLGE
jgi:hypothetical protein